MKVYVSFDGDHIGRMVGRASLADKPEEVSRIAQSIDRGNAIWRSWAESHGGRVINIGGDEGRLEIEADHLEEFPKIRRQYEDAVGSTVSVGVGTRLSEADKSLMAAKAQGGDRIQLYTEEVEEILANLKPKTEGEKLADEYLDPETGLNKAQPAMNSGSGAGFQGASRSRAAAPQAPTEGSEHSEAEVAQHVTDQAPAPETTHAAADAKDYESMFHQLAQQQGQEQPQRPTGLSDDSRQKVVQVLQQIRGKAQQLEQMKATNPDLYQSVVGLVQAMIAMARGQAGDQQQPQQESVQKAESECKHFFGRGTKCLKCKAKKEDLDKAALDPGKTGRHQTRLAVGSQIDPGPGADHEAGKIKILDPETGKTKWRSVRSGLVMAPDGTPTSSRNS